MTVVLRAPPTGRHATTNAIKGNLESTIQHHTARNAVVTTLVHEPATTTLDDRQHHHAEGREETPLPHKISTEDVHADDFSKAQGNLATRRLKESLLLELTTQGSIILGQFLAVV